MKNFLNSTIKLTISAGFVAFMLTGCGSSSEDEQLAWLSGWNNQYEAKMQMMNVCFNKIGVNLNKQMSKKQEEELNKCEFAYMSEQAEKDGVSLDMEFLKNNVMQF